ncbi:MAG: transposase [Methanomassiliicoccus sp.]|nr:transposase [Methanomassiliicoccus sp.]
MGLLVYKFLLLPNKDQEGKLLQTLEVCRKAYNRLLEEYYKGEHDRFVLQALLPVWKEEDADLKTVYAKVLQYEVHRLLYSQKGLEGRKKHGHKVGKLRWKPPQRFRSFTYNQLGFKLQVGRGKTGALHLSKIGDIPICLHREVIGKIKQVTVKHMPSGEWYALMAVDDGQGGNTVTFIERAVGIDVGLEHYLVDSEGLEIENPRHLKNGLEGVRKEHLKLNRKVKGSHNYEKQRIKVARAHERVDDQRNDFQHKLSRHYVDNYDLIVTEKLDIKEMIENGHMAGSINDAAWSSFNQKLAYKAERAGKLFVQVDPRGTSQECSCCGKLVPKTLKERWHDCPHCGLSMSRDHNASINILNRGIVKVGQELPELACGHWTATPLSKEVHAQWMKQEALS